MGAVSQWYVDTLPDHGWISDTIRLALSGEYIYQKWVEESAGDSPVTLIVTIHDSQTGDYHLPGCFGDSRLPRGLPTDMQIDVWIRR
jgi:hypothetical protein